MKLERSNSQISRETGQLDDYIDDYQQPCKEFSKSDVRKLELVSYDVDLIVIISYMPSRSMLTGYPSYSPALRPSGYTTAANLPPSTTTANKRVLMKFLLSFACLVTKDAKIAIEIRDMHDMLQVEATETSVSHKEERFQGES